MYLENLHCDRLGMKQFHGFRDIGVRDPLKEDHWLNRCFPAKVH